MVELFDRWGLKLRRNFDPLGLKDEEKIESTINIVYDTFVYVLKAQGKSFQVSGFDRQSLKEEILLRNFESWLSIENFIKERLCSCFKIMEKAQAGGFSFTNSLDGWLPYIVCFVLVAGIVFVTFGLFGATVDYSKSISNVQDAQTKVTEVVEKKVDTVHKSLEKTQDVIGDSLKEVVKPHLEVTQMSLKSSALLQGEVFALQQQAEAQQARIQSLDEQAGLLQELGKSALDASVAAFNKTKMVEGRVDAIATVFSNGSLGELVSYVLELSRSQPMEAERFAYIKKAVDFIINKKV